MRDEHAGARAPDIGNKVKWAVVALITVSAAVVGALTLFRPHAAQRTVAEAFARVEEGDIAGVMEYVDPEGRLGTAWNENADGLRDTLSSLLERYRVDFEGLAFATKAEKLAAEVELTGGRVSVYQRGGESLPLATLDLEGTGLVFYVEKKGDRWLIEGVNYDFQELLSGEGILFSL